MVDVDGGERAGGGFLCLGDGRNILRMSEITILPAARAGFHSIWAILESTVREGAVYALDRDMTCDQACEVWFAPGNYVFAAARGAQVVGAYYLRANAQGGGAHVANAGFVTGPQFRGHGIARAMGEHCAEQARALGFKAIQFNFVVSANASAVHLWQSLGYAIVGTLPRAFVSPEGVACDVFVMHRFL